MTSVGTPIVMGCAVALTLALGGCGTAASPRSIVGAQQLADRLHQQINGTAIQREAGNYLVWRALNDPVKECMAKAGYKLRPTFFPLEKGLQAKGNGTSGTIWLGEPHLRIVSEQAQGGVLENRAHDAKEAEPATRRQSTDAYQRAAHRCDSKAAAKAGSPESLAQAKGSEKLSGELNSVIFAVDESLGNPDDYASCMANSGFDVRGGDDEGYSAMNMYLLRKLPPSSQIPAPGESAGSAWTAFLDLEGKVLDADAACRQSEYERGMAELGPKLANFAEVHKAEIAAVVAKWNNMVTQAQREGFKP